MCTFYQNARCGARNACGRCNCYQNTCGCTTGTVGNTCGCTGTVGNTNGNLIGTGCCRYLSFPVSGTAYVPTSAVYFCANYVGANGNANGNINGNTNGNTGGIGGGNCCGFGRCGGARAISNYYEDYYARQYGLND